jgi:hypothetical protein
VRHVAHNSRHVYRYRIVYNYVVCSVPVRDLVGGHVDAGPPLQASRHHLYQVHVQNIEGGCLIYFVDKWCRGGGIFNNGQCLTCLFL